MDYEIFWFAIVGIGTVGAEITSLYFAYCNNKIKCDFQLNVIYSDSKQERFLRVRIANLSPQKVIGLSQIRIVRDRSRKKALPWPKYRANLGYDRNLPVYLVTGKTYDTQIEASAFSCILARNYKGELTADVLPKIKLEVVLTNKMAFKFKLEKGMIKFITAQVDEENAKHKSFLQLQNEKRNHSKKEN